MTYNPFRIFPLALIIITSLSLNHAFAAGDAPIPPKQDWSFNGIFGTFDIPAAQRGLQVYTEVCASCHSLNLVSFRHLSDLGFSEQEIKAYAAEFTVIDGPNNDGEMFERAALPSDFFVPPFANEQAARSANNNAYPKDLSLATKDSVYGADYVYALISNGYIDPPEDHPPLDDGMYYNQWMAGNAIAMPPPLGDDLVEYSDGTEATIQQMAYDVVNFLAWTSEPEMERRKRLGLRVMIVLSFMTLVSFLVYRRVWKNVKH
jgi:ubiquinol-cytochrome c reductase cytochrome c1 subunit